MQVTTGHNDAKRHLLFRISCALGAVIALATFLLIWTYRTVELRDLREHDIEIHQLLSRSLVGLDGVGGSLHTADQEQELSSLMSRGLLGFSDSSSRIFCPHLSPVFIAAGGLFIPANQPFARPPLSQVSVVDVFDDTPSGFSHVSSWPLTHKHFGKCRLDIFTNLDTDAKRIFTRSYHIAVFSIILEGFFMLSLLWIARCGDERLVESEREQNAMESDLFFLAHYDTLTHLPNRSLFWERLDAAISRAARLGKAVSLILVDLREFSQLNDDEGRTVGDRALVEAARRIQASARASDLVCRIGSDEFVILLEDLAPEHVAEATRRLCTVLARHFDDSWTSVCQSPVCCNCGGSTYPQDGSESEDLLSCATQALKHAKHINSHVCFYDKDS